MQYRIASVLALAGLASAAYKVEPTTSAEVYPTSSAEASSSGYPAESYPASSAESSSAATYSASSASTTAYTTSTIYSTNSPAPPTRLRSTFFSLLCALPCQNGRHFKSSSDALQRS